MRVVELAKKTTDRLYHEMWETARRGTTTDPRSLARLRDVVIGILRGQTHMIDEMDDPPSPEQIERGVYVGRDPNDPTSVFIDFVNFKHGCSACVFLGCHERYDLYQHMDARPGQINIVARYGDEDEAYTSFTGRSSQDVPVDTRLEEFEAIRTGFQRAEQARGW